MAFTWDEINRDFLGFVEVPLAPEVLVATFNTVERVLGRDVVLSHCTLEGGGHMSGSMPTLNVADLGSRLAAIEGLANTSKLINKLRSGDSSAYAELTAIYLLRSGTPDLEIEVEPDTNVEGRLKRPDFKARRPGEPWLHVEVTQPDIADAETDLAAKRLPLFDLLSIDRSFAIEIYFRRDPTIDEVQMVLARARELCLLDEQRSEEIGSIGILSINHTTPGTICVTEIAGEPTRPIMAATRFSGGGGQAPRQVVVRIAYSDDRAEAFLKREAKQLPTDGPGMVMVQMSHARGGPKAWTPLLKRRLQPNVNTRVSGITMFESGHEPTASGEALIHRATLLTNQHARHALPTWVASSLQQYPPWTPDAVE